MAYKYGAELTRDSVRKLYNLPPILIIVAMFAAWLGWHALRTHTAIAIGQRKMNWPWWEGFLWSLAFLFAAGVALRAARTRWRQLQKQERDYSGL
jgi:hypothetical protein